MYPVRLSAPSNIAQQCQTAYIFQLSEALENIGKNKYMILIDRELSMPIHLYDVSLSTTARIFFQKNKNKRKIPVCKFTDI